jgi:hypothetical protein
MGHGSVWRSQLSQTLIYTEFPRAYKKAHCNHQITTPYSARDRFPLAQLREGDFFPQAQRLIEPTPIKVGSEPLTTEDILRGSLENSIQEFNTGIPWSYCTENG